MADQTIRDAQQIVALRNELQEYVSNMKKIANSLVKAVEDSRNYMKDSASREALKQALLLAKELLTGLPDIDSLFPMLDKQLKIIREFEELKFR